MLSLEADVYLKDIGLWLDPGAKKSFAFVSHGHSDHLRRHERVLLSEATALFYRAAFGGTGEVMARAFHQPFSVNGCTVELFPSGHMLGAAQILVEGEQRVVYTGDFKLEHGQTSEPAQIKTCDILIMECTYGQPRYVFPPREEIYETILHFVEQCFNDNRVPVFYAYRLGKAQEAMKLLGDRNIPVAVPPPVFETARLYEQAGVTFSGYTLYTGGLLKQTALVGPWTMARQGLLDGIKNKRTAALTGWAVNGAAHRFGVDIAFPLSDHADFPGLLNYIRNAQPKKVYTLHGPRSFSKHVRAAGFEAQPLPLKPTAQLSLW